MNRIALVAAAVAACATLLPAAAVAQVQPGMRAQDARARWAEAQIKRLDRNGDNVISRSEWPRAAQAFDRTDQNKDGVLGADELQGAMRVARQRIAQRRARQVQARMRQLDTDGNRVLSREEWAARGPSFDQIDINKNGLLEPGELRRALVRQRGGRPPR